MINDGDFFCGVTAETLELAAGQVCMWPQSEITYAFKGYMAELGKEVQRGLTRHAFDAAEAVCGITIHEINDPAAANIQIGASRGQRNQFDGPSGVLAWCQLPCGGNPQHCELQFDLDETWLVEAMSAAGILYFNVCQHELTHGLGVSHAPAGALGVNIMAPFYSKNVSTYGPWDIAELQKRYGPPRQKPPPTPLPTPTPGEPGTIIQVGAVIQPGRYRLVSST